MSATPPDPPDRSAPPVLDKVPRPLGLLPRHTQTWVVAGLAVVMVAIIAFTGNPTPTDRRPAIPPLPMTVDPNQTRIQEYRTHLDEQTRRLAAEQAELAAAKRALADSTPHPAPGSADPEASDRPSDGANASLEQEQLQREYRSLFADNLALTLRAPQKGQATEPPAVVAAPLTTASAALPSFAGSTGRPLTPSSPPTAVPTLPRTTDAGASAPLPRPSIPASVASSSAPQQIEGDSAERASARHSRLLEGTIIETVLTNRLEGSYAGPVTCLVTTPVYAHDYQRVLIPRGSRLLGTASPVSQYGQQRLAVAFHRLVLPNGHTVSVQRFPALNQIGETGLRDQVNQHLLSIFGASLAVGAIAGLAQLDTRVGFDASAGDVYRQGVSSSVAQSSLRILDRFLNRLPTLTIREGHRIKVYLTADLDLPVYEDR